MAPGTCTLLLTKQIKSMLFFLYMFDAPPIALLLAKTALEKSRTKSDIGFFA